MQILNIEDLHGRLRTLEAETSERVLVGITGEPGVGKTTLAESLLGPAVGWVPMDGFHLSNNVLEQLGLRARKGAPETFDAHGYAALLRRLRHETQFPVYAPVYDRAASAAIAAGTAITPEHRVVLSEGNYLLLDTDPWAELRDIFDEIWYLQLDDDVRRERLLARHIASGKTSAAAHDWVEHVDQVNAARVRETIGRADLIVRGR